MGQSKLWTKDFMMIASTNFFTHVVFYLLMTTVAMHAITAYNVGSGVAGLATGIFVLASLLARLFAGKYLDRFGRKRMLVGALALFVIAMFLHFIQGGLLFLFVIRFIHGLSHGFITTAAGAIAADLIPDERRGEGTGYYATSMNLAMAIGPFLGLFIIGRAGFMVVVLVGSIVAAINFISGLITKVPEVEEEEELEKKPGFTIKDYVEPKAIPISITMFTITIAYSSLLSFLSLYAEEINLGDIASLFFVVYAAALLATRPFTGKGFDLYGANRMTYPLLICLSIGFILLSLTGKGFIFLLAGALIGIGYGTAQSNYQAIAIKESPSNRKSMATSTFFIFMDLGTGLGPVLLGIIAGWINFRQLYLVMGIWVILSIGIYYLAHGRKSQAKYQKAHHEAS